MHLNALLAITVGFPALSAALPTGPLQAYRKGVDVIYGPPTVERRAVAAEAYGRRVNDIFTPTGPTFPPLDSINPHLPTIPQPYSRFTDDIYGPGGPIIARSAEPAEAYGRRINDILGPTTPPFPDSINPHLPTIPQPYGGRINDIYGPSPLIARRDPDAAAAVAPSIAYDRNVNEIPGGPHPIPIDGVNPKLPNYPQPYGKYSDEIYGGPIVAREPIAEAEAAVAPSAYSRRVNEVSSLDRVNPIRPTGLEGEGHGYGGVLDDVYVAKEKRSRGGEAAA